MGVRYCGDVRSAAANRQNEHGDEEQGEDNVFKHGYPFTDTVMAQVVAPTTTGAT